MRLRRIKIVSNQIVHLTGSHDQIEKLDNSNVNSEVHNTAIQKLRNIYDPEISINIYDLGLIYKIDTAIQGKIAIEMTLTSPACPIGDSLVNQVKTTLLSIAGINEVEVCLVWDPPWSKDNLSEETKLYLDLL